MIMRKTGRINKEGREDNKDVGEDDEEDREDNVTMMKTRIMTT
jgi:hypothetical protein